jgi:UDP-N-acetylmuramate dehydrogenase
MTRIIHHTVETPLFAPGLEKRLPKVRGRLTPSAPLRQFSWLGAGGPAEILFRPEDRDDLISFIQGCPRDVPVTILGVMSNVIIRDGGIPGVVVRLGRDFSHILAEGERIRAGAAAMDMNVALVAADNGVAGLEFLSGVPGTVGGALRMNAGAYGAEMKDVLETADVLFRDGTVRQMTPAEMAMTYRKNALPDDVLFLGATLKGCLDDKEEIARRMLEIKDRRSQTQPIRTKTGGSTFANPGVDDPKITKKAWELIDTAGCRGLKIGEAQMSEMHCNFMINTGNATAADLERLGEEVRRRVREHSGVTLRWEIKRIGVPLEKDADIREFIKARGSIS